MKLMTALSITAFFCAMSATAQTNYPANPWCGAKGAPYHLTPPTTVAFSPAATPAEIEFIKGLKALNLPSDQLEQLETIAQYINKKSVKMGGSNSNNYDYMGSSLNDAAKKYCGVRVNNEHNFYSNVIKVSQDYVSEAISLEKTYIPILEQSAKDCYGFQDEYKKFKDINYPIIEDKEKAGKNLGKTLNSCLNFTQQFVAQPTPGLYKK